MRTVKNESITGTSLKVCAVNVTAALDLRPTCYHKVLEILTTLAREGYIILADAQLRLKTEEERRAAREAQEDNVRRTRNTRKRTATKRVGGFRTKQLRTTRPLPPTFVS